MTRIKLWHYILIGVLSTLLFSVTTNAATIITYPEVNIPVANGNNITVVTQSYQNLEGTIIEAEEINGTPQSWYRYDPTFTVWMRGTNQQWLNGYMSIDFYYTIPAMLYLSSYDIQSLSDDEGIHVNIDYNASSYIRIRVFFDNVYNDTNRIDIAQITLHFVDTETAYSATAAESFTTRLVNQDSNIEKSLTVINDRTSALIYSAITQANGQQLANILSSLQAIQNQDYVYYAQLVSGINQLHTDNNQLHGDLLNILNEIDLDFAAVQTVLDLFPSYRTQVLQYWQELLQMNASQSSAAAEIESQYADRESQSSQLINGMGSVVMPSISSNDLDILGTVDTTQKANFFGIIALITHNELITKIMLIIVLGAIVGYILYGKK